MFLFPSPIAEAKIGLKRAFEAGRVFEPGWSGQINTRYWEWANDQSESLLQHVQTDYQSVWSASKTARYYDNSMGFFTHPDITRDWRVEVARYPVPEGRIGVIRAFEQYLSLDQTVVSQNWGNPNVGNGRWIFRLSNYDGSWPTQINQLSPFPILPGTVYDDFPEDSGVWFPAGSPSANNVRFLVPQKFMLRVIWQSGLGYDSAPVVGARLRGALSSLYANATIENIRGSWS